MKALTHPKVGMLHHKAPFHSPVVGMQECGQLSFKEGSSSDVIKEGDPILVGCGYAWVKVKKEKWF